MNGNSYGLSGMQDQDDRDGQRRSPSSERLTMFCPLYVIGRCGRISCSLPAAITLPVNVSDPRITSSASTAIMNGEHVRRAQVIFGDADHRDAERAEGVAERGSLRHGGHLHHAEGDADDRAEHQRDDDPPVFDDSVVQQRAADGQQHAQLAGPDAAARRGGRAHPLERQDEEHRGDDVRKFDES